MDKYVELRAALEQTCHALLIDDPDMIRALLAERDALRDALKNLIRGYVYTLEGGRDMIVSLGGQCDPVEIMESIDPYLSAARAALAQGEE